MSRFSLRLPPQENATWLPSGESDGSSSSPGYVVTYETLMGRLSALRAADQRAPQTPTTTMAIAIATMADSHFHKGRCGSEGGGTSGTLSADASDATGCGSGK